MRMLRGSGEPKSQGSIKNARKAINKIASILKKRDFVRAVGIQATEVFVGGSVGQGTAVPRQYDVDIVLYSRDLQYKAAVDNDGYEDVLMKLKEYLKMTLGDDNYTQEDQSKVALRFNYQVPEGGDVDVDLLLSPFWKSEDDFFNDLAHVIYPIKRLLFSASTSKYQTMFIRHMKSLNFSMQQTSRVKELIRRAKGWRNRSWMGEKSGRPKSYLMSLLVITAYSRLQESEHEKEVMVFKTLARRVGEEMKLLVFNIATNDQLDLTIPGTDLSIREKYAHLLPDKPRIVDPVNPSNNLYLSGVGRDPYDYSSRRWGEFQDKVKDIKLKGF